MRFPGLSYEPPPRAPFLLPVTIARVDTVLAHSHCPHAHTLAPIPAHAMPRIPTAPTGLEHVAQAHVALAGVQLAAVEHNAIQGGQGGEVAPGIGPNATAALCPTNLHKPSSRVTLLLSLSYMASLHQSPRTISRIHTCTPRNSLPEPTRQGVGFPFSLPRNTGVRCETQAPGLCPRAGPCLCPAPGPCSRGDAVAEEDAGVRLSHAHLGTCGHEGQWRTRPRGVYGTTTCRQSTSAAPMVSSVTAAGARGPALRALCCSAEIASEFSGSPQAHRLPPPRNWK